MDSSTNIQKIPEIFSRSKPSPRKMSGSSVFISNISEQRWVDQLNEHFVIYVENGPSIFHVPQSVRDTNPEAYTPQKVGIGAYNHFRIDKRKLEALKKFLKPRQYSNFKSLIVDKVKELQADIRSCYDKYLDLDDDTLAWIMAIDGVYMLHLLSTYSGKVRIETDDRNLAKDIMMVENQIPCIVLKEIRKALQPQFENDEEKEDDVQAEEVKNDADLFAEILSMCKAHTPLDLTDDAHFVADTTSPHLLHYMYTLIMQNWSTGDTIQADLDEEAPEDTPLVGNTTRTSPPFLSKMNSLLMKIRSTGDTIGEGLGEVAGDLSESSQVAADLTGRKTFLLLANLPLKQFAELFPKNYQKTNLSIGEIQIPSASEMHQVCKIQFHAWPWSGIGVKYDDKNRILYLPMLRLNTDSEVILRNLEAYEAASGSSNVVSGYVDFMCGIIDTAKDVDLLKEKAIIKSDLPSDEIAKIFNGIRKSDRMRPDLEGTVQELKRIDDNTFRVKAWRFVKNHLIPSEAVAKGFLATLMVLLLTVQAFCQIYGCNARSPLKMINFI